MRKTFAVLASSAFLGAAGVGVGFIGSGVASAASASKAVPNTPRCSGQATALTAQGYVGGGPGIGNFSMTHAGLPAGPNLIHNQTTGIAHYCATGIIGP
jgi:hypothetical protein